MSKTPRPAEHTFAVRQVRRGFWTYDLIHAESANIEYSVGECHSRREAEKKARAACRQAEAEMTARQGWN